jgi:hypothetical protein
MEHLLLFYYNELGQDIPENYKEILELCELNSNTFTTAFIEDKNRRMYEDQFIIAHSIAIVDREKMGMFLCGVGLYFYEIGDNYSASLLFELALPSSNIVSLVFMNKLKLTDVILVDRYTDVKNRCKEMIIPFMSNDIIDIPKILFDEILKKRIDIRDVLQHEKETYALFTDATRKTVAAIKEALEFSTCTIDFDIESFFNDSY